MLEIPEYWISIRQKEDFKSLLSSESLPQFSKPLLSIFFNSGYDLKEKIFEFLKTPEGISFYELICQYSEVLLVILLNSGFDNLDKIKDFFKTSQEKESYKLLFKSSDIFLKILLNRGIDTLEKIDYFLKSPQGKDYYDPFLLPNMELATNRVLRAINNKENILIFGDYDADGIISTALIYSFLKNLGLNPKYQIPNRIEDGYDISLKFIKKLKKENPEISLIICVDCGSNSHEVKEYIYKNNNLDIIVCDHHKISEKSISTVTDSSRFIVVNPQDLNSEYPFKFLSGAGVTFKFINAILMRLDSSKKDIFKQSYLTDFLDLVAVSTIADLMPLIDENRLIVKKGLEVLKNTKNTGLKKLIKSVLPGKERGNENLTTYDVGYIIAPRINAPGRINDAKKGLNDAEKGFKLNVAPKSFKLLICDATEAECLVNEINELNEQRKIDQAEMLNKILEKNKNDFEDMILNQKIFIEKSKEWRVGLLGLVASNLVKKYNIPVILFKEDEAKYKGSGRSIEEFDLFENLNTLNRYFDKFGGHKMACGLTIKADYKKNEPEKEKKENKYQLFKQEMIKVASEKLSEVKIGKKFYYDMEVDFNDLKPSLGKELKFFEPFGTGNPKPVFLMRDCIIRKISFLKNEKHVSLQIKNKGSYKKAIFFNISSEIAENLKNISEDTPVSILFNVEENMYEKNINAEGRSLQLIILDLFYKIDLQ